MRVPCEVRSGAGEVARGCDDSTAPLAHDRPLLLAVLASMLVRAVGIRVALVVLRMALRRLVDFVAVGN